VEYAILCRDEYNMDVSLTKWFNQAIANLADEQNYAFCRESLIEFKKEAQV
jgi:hypothetical protein